MHLSSPSIRWCNKKSSQTHTAAYFPPPNTYYILKSPHPSDLPTRTCPTCLSCLVGPAQTDGLCSVARGSTGSGDFSPRNILPATLLLYQVQVSPLPSSRAVLWHVKGGVSQAGRSPRPFRVLSVKTSTLNATWKPTGSRCRSQSTGVKELSNSTLTFTSQIDKTWSQIKLVA